MTTINEEDSEALDQILLYASTDLDAVAMILNYASRPTMTSVVLDENQFPHAAELILTFLERKERYVQVPEEIDENVAAPTYKCMQCEYEGTFETGKRFVTCEGCGKRLYLVPAPSDLDPLPKCKHQYNLVDHKGNLLTPPCGCRAYVIPKSRQITIEDELRTEI